MKYYMDSIIKYKVVDGRWTDDGWLVVNGYRIAYAPIFSKNMISNSKINIELRGTNARPPTMKTVKGYFHRRFMNH